MKTGISQIKRCLAALVSASSHVFKAAMDFGAALVLPAVFQDDLECLPLCDIFSPALAVICDVPLFAPPAALSLRSAMRNKYQGITWDVKPLRGAWNSVVNVILCFQGSLCKGHCSFLFLRVVLLVSDASRVKKKIERKPRSSSVCKHKLSSTTCSLLLSWWFLQTPLLLDSWPRQRSSRLRTD